MYQLYAESCVFQSRAILSETIFRVVFKTNFELSLVKSQTQRFQICDAKEPTEGRFVQNHKIIEERNMNRTMHIEMVKKVQMNFTKTVEMSQSFGENIEVFTFELQKVMDLPYLSNSDVFFKKQLWLSIQLYTM